MKKHLFTFAIITCAILISSCSMMKRRYTNGYYISHSNNNPATAITQEQVNEKKNNPSLYTIKNKENNNPDYSSKPIAIAENEPISVNNQKTISKSAPAIIHKRHLGYNAEKIILEQENTKTIKAKKSNTESLAEDALSLFWIIILILLILWLVAILTGGWGLGWTVHLLLVIALILLILWLLRII
ncbi:MAG TPA: DUF5670 family protein [Bacteroidia bacterium]|nr:DUF5670 family protein [Bacteroidia bacterium]